MRVKLTMLLLLVACTEVASQVLQREVNEQVQFWTSINSTTRISNHFGAVADVHIRRNNFVRDPSFYFLRAGGAYWLDDQFSFVMGLAALWLATDTEVGLTYALERRIYQQALWRANIGRVTFLQRIRTEQRWHEVLDTSTGEVDRIRFSNRFRFLFSATIKAFENENLPKFTLANEIMFHTGEEVVLNTFEQNRFFAGINQKLGQDWVMDFGYMIVYQQKYSGYQYDLNHTLRLFFYFFPDLRKKNKERDDLPHYPVGTPIDN